MTCGHTFSQDRARAEIPYEGRTVVIEADRLSRDVLGQWIAEGNVIVTYQDTILKAPQLIYDPDSGNVRTDSAFELTRGLQFLKGTRADINIRTQTGVLTQVEGFTDQELFVKAERLIRTGVDTYVAQNGFLTACAEDVPIWSFKVAQADIQPGGNARLKSTFFRIKNIPLLYFPALIVPTGQKPRSSGFLLPTTGTSSNKGRRISDAFYLVLGRSADATVHADYFSERGFGYGLRFRTRPNESSYLELDGYLVNDRLDQGGASVIGFGETRFGDGYRAVADFNLVTNFTFRQVFADNFYAATRPTENSRFFLTNNQGTRSFNFLLSSEQTVFPVLNPANQTFSFTNVVTQAKPGFGFKLTGKRLFGVPVFLDLDTSAEGLNRRDQLLETPEVTQRLDFFPQVYFSLPLFQGLRLTPRLGFRETFYSDSLEEGAAGPGPIRISGDDLHRRYGELNLDLRGWGLSRIYRNAQGGGWKHLIEPAVRYRYISGIDEFERIIRFDERDAVADTNGVEYALYNRFFVKRQVDGAWVTHELLSIKLAQQNFFDPDFGGAFNPNAVNQFSPINSLTGFRFGATRRSFSPLVTQVRINPLPSYSFDVRGDYDPHFDRFSNFSVTGFYVRDWLNVGTTYFVTRKTEAGTEATEQIQGQIGLGNFTRGLSVSTIFSYDAELSRFLTHRSRINYFWDCFGISLEYQGFNIGLREERQIRFSFFLKGIGSFGTISRPESIF